MRRGSRFRSVRILAGAGLVLAGMLAGMNCSFQGGTLVGDGGTSTKAYGHTGADDRFTWSDDEVVDRAYGIAWDRHAHSTERLSHADAVRSCEATDARLPTRAELDGISEFLATDLFDPGSPSDDMWSSAGEALGRSGAHAVSDRNLVRCVRPLH